MPKVQTSWKCYYYNESGKLVHAATFDNSYDPFATGYSLAGKLFQNIKVVTIGNYCARVFIVNAFHLLEDSGTIKLKFTASDELHLLYGKD